MSRRPLQLVSRPEALDQPYAARPDEALTVDQVRERLGHMSKTTFYRRDELGYWKRHGLVELPRCGTKGSRRLFSAASVDRFIRTGGNVGRVARRA